MTSIFVLAKDFGNHHAFWSQSNFAWGCLSSASVYSQAEVKSMFREPTEDDPARARYVNDLTGSEDFVPGDGEWWSLPDNVRLMTREEYIADL